MFARWISRAGIAGGLLCASLYGQSATPQTAAADEYFEKNVRPVLVANCQGCHNAKMKSSGLDLSTATGFWAGGTGGALIAKDQLEASRFIKVIATKSR